MKALQYYSFNPGQSADPKKIVIFLHGYGADGKDLISIAPLWAESLPETVFYAPNAPEICEMSPHGFQWFSLADRGEGAMLSGAKYAHDALKAYIGSKMSQHNLTLGDVAIVGFSQGTMMALYTMPRLEESCAGVLAYSGRLVGQGELAAETRVRFPVCAIHGTADEIVPFDSLEGIKTGLTAFDVATHSRPGLGHGIDEEGLRIGHAFLKDILR